MNVSAPWPADILERMGRAVEKVQERLHRAAKALEAQHVPYAIIGGNAVAAWVARIDEGAVRTTRDVDILIRREDLEAAKVAMDTVGFEYTFSYGVHLFVERPNGKPSEGVTHATEEAMAATRQAGEEVRAAAERVVHSPDDRDEQDKPD